MDRQKAALIVMGVEQRELLMAMYRVAGIVDVERDRGRRAPVAFAEPIHQRRHQSGDLDLRRRILQPRRESRSLMSRFGVDRNRANVTLM
jgi:hypothetical protein